MLRARRVDQLRLVASLVTENAVQGSFLFSCKQQEKEQDTHHAAARRLTDRSLPTYRHPVAGDQ